jgi:hypothetical protein
MPLQKILDNYKQRLSTLNNAVKGSTQVLNEKELDVKKHLANHNALLGAQTEAETVVKMLNEEASKEVVPPQE